MLEWLMNKFVIAALLIYVIPGVIGCSMFMSKLGHPPLGALDAFLTFTICLLFAPISFVMGMTYSPYPSSNIGWMSPPILITTAYYLVSYSFLIFYKFEEKEISIFLRKRLKRLRSQ
jgi:hypothetical protein